MTRVLSASFLMVMAGCAETPSGAVLELDPAESVAAPDFRSATAAPQVMTLLATDFVPGDLVTMEVSGASPGDTVTFLRGTAGTSCPAPLGGLCLGIADPKILGHAVVDATGEAIDLFELPLSVPVELDLQLQAVVNLGASSYASDVLDMSTESVCGDGLQQSDEACDDDNLIGGDGCSVDCELEGPLTYDFRVYSALVDDDDQFGLTWNIDPFGIFDAPDVYYKLSINGGTVYTSPIDEDDFTPSFSTTVTLEVDEHDLVEVAFFDEDSFDADDVIGTLSFTRADLGAIADQGSQTGADNQLLEATYEVWSR